MLRVLGQPQRTIALRTASSSALIGLVASALGVALGFAVHYVFVLLLGGLVEARAAAASAVAGAVRPRHGPHAAVRLRPAAGAAAGAGAAAARDPARRRRPEAGVARGAGRRRGGFAALLLAASSDLKLGAIAVGGFAGAVLCSRS